MSAEELKIERKKLDEQFKHLYSREQDLDDRIKDFELQQARVKKLKDELNNKKNEVSTLNSELKMKQKMLVTMDDKIKQVEGPAELADQIIQKTKENEEYQKKVDEMQTELKKNEEEKIQHKEQIQEIQQKLEVTNSEQAKAERAKADEALASMKEELEQKEHILEQNASELQEKDKIISDLNTKIDDLFKEYEEKFKEKAVREQQEAEEIRQEEEKLNSKISELKENLQKEINSREEIEDKLSQANTEIGRMKTTMQKLESDMQMESLEFKNKMEKQRKDFIGEFDQQENKIEQLETDKRELARQLSILKKLQSNVEEESKNLENKLKTIQNRYDSRFEEQEEKIQNLTVENTQYRHKNELLKIDITDLEFRLKRTKQAEKTLEVSPQIEQIPSKILEERLEAVNGEYNELLKSVDNYSAKIDQLGQEIMQLTDDKKDAFNLVEKKREKIRLAERRIQDLERQINTKKMHSDLTVTKVRNEAEKKLKKAVSHKEGDLRLFKQKVKSSEIQIKSKNKEIKYLKNKIERLERILKVHKLKENISSMVDKTSIIEKWREEESCRPKESTMSDSNEKEVSQTSSSEKRMNIHVKEPEYAPEDPVRLPMIKKNTNLKDILNHDIYKKSEIKTLRTNSSVPEITFRKDASMEKEKEISRESSKYASLHTHSRSNASIFKERYDKNLENYLSSLDYKRYNHRKNASSVMGMLMSPSLSNSKRTEL
ncbi:unnamed protein product [Moneuplotes crassus]|uniref:Uncharacterized protein n=1 Tax=Euplotes crassus TaxID=5936 RepID=A0AAD1YA48_EUPCR|nr:unnamed protein product [Moneuplotes crassus]